MVCPLLDQVSDLIRPGTGLVVDIENVTLLRQRIKGNNHRSSVATGGGVQPGHDQGALHSASLTYRIHVGRHQAGGSSTVYTRSDSCRVEDCLFINLALHVHHGPSAGSHAATLLGKPWTAPFNEQAIFIGHGIGALGTNLYRIRLWPKRCPVLWFFFELKYGGHG